jgi:hypothetical protein
MKNILITIMVVGFGLASVGCEKKSTDEQLKDNTEKEVELLKKSVSENTAKLEKEIKEEVDNLKK